MGRQERLALIQKIETQRKSKVLCYLTSDRPNQSSQISKDAMPFFYEHLRQFGSPDRVDVLMFTLGGDTLAAFGLAQLVRQFTDWIGVLVPEKCQSGGTLFALGADEIVMTRAATLGPIDPSISGPLNPTVEQANGQKAVIPLSVETVAGFQALVTEEWGMKGEEALVATFSLLAERVHPLALGDVVRARGQIQRLARHLLANHNKDEGQISKIIDTLTRDLGSHDYLIFRREARQILDKQIAADNQSVEDTMWELYRDFASEMELGQPFEPMILIQHPPKIGHPMNVILRQGIVESLAGSEVAEIEMTLTKTQVVPPQGGGKVDAAIPSIVRSEWKHYA